MPSAHGCCWVSPPIFYYKPWQVVFYVKPAIECDSRSKSGCKMEELLDVCISESATRVGNLAFSDCKKLLRVTIPNSVTEIGHYAFSGCSSLRSLNIPEHVTEIGHGAFDGCTSLANLTIPNSVTEIGTGAFRGCSSLSDLQLPESLRRGRSTSELCKSVVPHKRRRRLMIPGISERHQNRLWSVLEYPGFWWTNLMFHIVSPQKTPQFTFAVCGWKSPFKSYVCFFSTDSPAIWRCWSWVSELVVLAQEVVELFLANDQAGIGPLSWAKPSWDDLDHLSSRWSCGPEQGTFECPGMLPVGRYNSFETWSWYTWGHSSHSCCDQTQVKKWVSSTLLDALTVIVDQDVQRLGLLYEQVHLTSQISFCFQGNRSQIALKVGWNCWRFKSHPNSCQCFGLGLQHRLLKTGWPADSMRSPALLYLRLLYRTTQHQRRHHLSCVTLYTDVKLTIVYYFEQLFRNICCKQMVYQPGVVGLAPFRGTSWAGGSGASHWLGHSAMAATEWWEHVAWNFGWTGWKWQKKVKIRWISYRKLIEIQ